LTTRTVFPVEFPDGFQPNSNLDNNHFTNRYRHTHQLSLPVTKDRLAWKILVSKDDYHGFGVVVGKYEIFYNYKFVNNLVVIFNILIT
jgi:hypothetical protein